MAKYERNIGAITHDEQMLLGQKSACVVGCGGLGCYVIEMLARIGIGSMTVIDGDTYGESNMNRQLFARFDNLGASKVIEAAKRCKLIAPSMQINPVKAFLNPSNATALLDGHDIIFDALDNPSTRITLQNACEQLGIVLIHAAVCEWQAQISVVFPGDRSLTKLYGDDRSYPTPSVPAFSPCFAASLEVNEGIKVLLDRGEHLRGKLLVVDLLNNSFETLSN